MTHLIADRFLELRMGATIDCATAQEVDVAITRAGDRAEQQRWAEACARSLADPRSRLIDFGFIGSDRRFIASARTIRPPISEISPIEIISHAVEWLEHSSPASPRLFVVSGVVSGLRLALPRELRLRGFVSLHLEMFADTELRAAVSGSLAGRSVVLLHDEPSGSDVALGFLHLLSSKTRHSWGIVGRPKCAERPALWLSSQADPGWIAHAAEGRAAFDQPASRQRFTLMLDEARSMMARGRHAAAERSLRASLAAFDRRRDATRAGDAALLLGELLQTRGRSADAYELFERARANYERQGAAVLAVQACTCAGLAQTDRGLLNEAEAALRAAYSAATALPDPSLQLTAGVALARCLLWQSRQVDAGHLLETLTPRQGDIAASRYWCMAARLRVLADDLSGAWSAAARAREASGGANPAHEGTVRTAEAIVQAKLGDVEAMECHVREGLRAAAEAHLPLQAVRLRLTLLEGLLDAKRSSRAREVGARLRSLARIELPPLLAKRLARGLERLATPAAHETAPVFSTNTRAVASHGDLGGLSQLLSLCHDAEDERDALARCAFTIKKHSGALAVGIFGVSGSGSLMPLASAGASCHTIGQRCVTLGQPIGVERVAAGFEGAVPVRYLSRVIGSLACRWSADGPLIDVNDVNANRMIAFCSAAAAACAPLVYMLLESSSLQPAGVGAGTGAVARVADGAAGSDLIGASAPMDEVRRAIARAANAPFTVLIEGESGSGKELVARAIHQTGCRRERRFCALNCAAMPEDLVDTELFGHAKGAFTGAAIERLGLFESADQGTVFLDEVGELSSRAQAKLLRVLQEGEIRRIGESFTRSIDARLVAATNRSLRSEVDAGRFRQDLLYRLDVIRIAVPPLRERVEDIPLLAARFWRHATERIGSKAVLGPGALSALARYDWPGNVRELQNVLTAMAVTVPARGVVGARHMPAAVARATTADRLETLDMARVQFEQRFVRAALARSAGHRGQTAAALGLTRQGLAKLMQRLQIDV
jgi:transcriptional regulator with GAF, ATPase, and Fis domain/tetratricopeptide (TPR) repeat protein